MSEPLFIGDAPLRTSPTEAPAGAFVTREGRRYYRIRHADGMAPFFMTVVSPSDHWLFIGSNGALTAGRRNSASALFPYYTSDKIMDSAHLTGPLTHLVVERDGRRRRWTPFSQAYEGLYAVERNLYKSVRCDEIAFEEINRDLDLTFRYAWSFSDRFGFVRTCTLANAGPACRIHLLDGVQNLLPHGVEPDAQNLYSNLLDAYKRSEYQADAGLAVFGLSSRLTDKAEPSEALRANTAWQGGLSNPLVLLSNRQVKTFTAGRTVSPESEVCGERCCFLLQADLLLTAGGTQTWRQVLELNQDHTQVANLAERLRRDRPALEAELDADLRSTSLALEALIGKVDGLQRTGVEPTTAHHYANVLFNTMRGGLYADGYRLQRDDVLRYLKSMNGPAYARGKARLDQLPPTFTLQHLKEAGDQSGVPDLARLGRQYLPLTFSRRHGDPSRPWNQFFINVRNTDGSQRLDYQGNWRDIFQNWEALNLSYPDYFENSICVFLNFTTADGYNPYRVSRAGIDWEKPEPHNPWANIGYWGDHQIIYLLKLLEGCEAFHPEVLAGFLDTPGFSHAQVPYKIRSYEAILANPFDTIEFDHDLDAAIEKRVAAFGHDGRLLMRADGAVVQATLLEKLLILLLTKLSNYVPGAGLWMNTQRPEWNDANNALVGRGASVVTLGYLRRFTAFLQQLLAASPRADFAIESSLSRFFDATEHILARHDPRAATRDDRRRRAVMDELGRAGADYRARYYQHGLSAEHSTLPGHRLADFLDCVLEWVDEGLRANRRPDGLYHAYNTLVLGEQATGINQLKEMLEGQVSAISSGALAPEEVLETLEALRHSALYRADQHAYLLYPNLPPPGFLHKNTVPAARLTEAPLLARLLAQGDRRLIQADVSGALHFQGDLRNRNDVQAVLEQMSAGGVTMTPAERRQVVDLFESLFDHARYTGRSGTFFAYEGLGSIYWHMVSKLLLAVQEVYFAALDRQAPSAVVQALRERYYDIRAGLGFNKTPAHYGAFPTDPYSHTPWGKGAQQPGMTGQVKEEVLTRFGELGLRVRAGVLHFEPTLLQPEEWLAQPDALTYVDATGTHRTLELPAGSLGFTYAQVPVTYIRSDRRQVVVRFADGASRTLDGASCGPEASRHILARDGAVTALQVYTDTTHA